MKKILLILLLAGIVLATFVCAALGALLLDPIELDFSLAGRVRHALGIEKADPDAVFVMIYELLLYAAAGLMAFLIGRQMHTELLTGRSSITEAYQLRTRRMQVCLGGVVALLLLGAGVLLAVRAGIWFAPVPGAALAVHWAVYMWKTRRQ